MPRTVFQGDHYKVTHTVEGDGPHITQKEHYCVDYFVITLLIHGRGNCFVEGNCYAMAPGDAVVMRANELRHFRFEQGGVHERISVYLSPSVVSPLWDSGLPLFRIFRDRPLGVGNKLCLNDGNGAAVRSGGDQSANDRFFGRPGHCSEGRDAFVPPAPAGAPVC